MTKRKQDGKIELLLISFVDDGKSKTAKMKLLLILLSTMKLLLVFLSMTGRVKMDRYQNRRR